MMVSVDNGQSRNHHVGVADGLYFVHVVVAHDGVEARVEIVQERDDLKVNKQDPK